MINPSSLAKYAATCVGGFTNPEFRNKVIKPAFFGNPL